MEKDQRNQDPAAGPAQAWGEETEEPVDSPRRRRLPVLLRQAWYSLNQAFRRRIAGKGVTPDQYTVLRTLLEGDPEGITQKSLVERMSSDPNTVTGLLARMERAGWIEKRPHEKDRRAYRIQIRAAGKRKHQEVRAIAVSLQSEILSALPPSRRESFLEDLGRIAGACQEAAEQAYSRSAESPDGTGIQDAGRS